MTSSTEKLVFSELGELSKFYSEIAIQTIRDPLISRLNMLEDQRRLAIENLVVKDEWLLGSVNRYFAVEKQLTLDKVLPILLHLKDEAEKIMIPDFSEFLNQVTMVKDDTMTPSEKKRLRIKKRSSLLKEWYNNHIEYPYPNKEEVLELARLTESTKEQVKRWFANQRNRANINNVNTSKVIKERKRKSSDTSNDSNTKKCRSIN